MTNDQLFKRWWTKYSKGYQPLDPHNDPVSGIRDAARAAFHAALSDEERNLCFDGLLESPFPRHWALANIVRGREE